MPGASARRVQSPSSVSTLGHAARLAVFWTTGFNLFRDVLQLGLTLTLARLLPPDVYGQFGLVSTLVTLLSVLSFREFLNYTLQVRRDEDTHYQDHFTAGAVIQMTVFLVANAAAGVMWLVPGYRPAAPLMHAMSLLFPLDLASELRVKMLERALDWRRLRLLHAAGLLGSAALSVTMALTGWGAWSLLLPTLLVPIPFTLDLFVHTGWRPTWEWDRERYGPAWRFGLTRISSVSLVSASQAVESAVLVRHSGFAALGFYSRAIGLANLACQKVSSVLSQALYPVLTRIDPGTDRYRRVSALMLRCVVWTVVPVALLISMTAAPVVRLLYGAQWIAAVPLVPWALAAVGIAAVTQTTYSLLLAYQQHRRCAVADAVRLAGICAGLVVLLPLGLKAYLAGVALTQALTLLLVVYWLYRLEAIRVRAVVDAFVPATVSALTGWACAEAVSRGLGAPADALWVAPAYAAMFGAVYLAALRVAFREQLDDLLGYLPHSGPLLRVLRLREAA